MTNPFERGVTTVEFAIIGVAMMLVLFGVIEVGRAMFVMNALGEATRRAARMATVCPINDPAIAQVGLFNPPGRTDNRIVGGLTPANFAVEYLDTNGGVLTDPISSFVDIEFVRTR